MTKRLSTQMSIFKTVGFWIAALMVVLQGLNAIRAFLNPVEYADYMGLSLLNASDIGFVYVYGLRAGFIALLVLLLLVFRRFEALSWMALAALIMPIGDAILAFNADAAGTTVLRHVVIAIYVGIAFFVLRRTAASFRNA